MYNTYYSPNRVANGNFSQIGNEEVENGDFSEVGAEEVTNGNFDTNSDWLFLGTAEISGGYGVFPDTTSSFIIQSIVSASVKQYKLQYEVIESNGGSLRLSGGSSAFGTVDLDNTVGTHTKYLTSNGSQTNIQFNNNNSFVGKIDNISVKEVGQGFTFGTGWGMGDGKAVCDGSQTGNTSLQQSGVAGSGKIYKLQFDLTVDAGFINYVNLGGWIDNTNLTTSDTYTYYTTTTTNTDNLGIAGDSNFVGSIDNLSVKEIGQGWSLGTGWSVEDNQLVSVAGSAAYTTQSGVGVVGRTYKVIADVAEVTAGLTYVYTGAGWYLLHNKFSRCLYF